MRFSMPSLLASIVLVSACSASEVKVDPSTQPAGDDTGVSGDGGAPGEDAPIPTDGLELTKGLGIKEIAVFQGPKVTIAADGAAVTSRKAPVIVGRPGILRVYVEPAGDWAPREVVATLTLNGGGSTKTLTEKKTVSGASTDQNLDSTFNFQLALDDVAGDTSYSVSLKTAPGQPSSGGSDRAQHPADGSADPMGAKGTGDVLRVKIVPVRYQADGSNRLPDTSPAQIERYRKRFSQLYPARQVEVTVRDPVAWPNAVQRTGSGWNQLLNAMIKLRQSDGAPKGVYYYGAFSPAASMISFCSSGCVAGLSPLATNPGDTWTAASIGLGFTGDSAASTATHEVGHGHGREHSPCGLGGQPADPKYPYSGANIGPISWDIEASKLVNPGSPKDFMSYCQPEWVSDWTFNALATRMAYVYGAKLDLPTTPTTYRLVSVDGDGKLEWGDAITTVNPPWGKTHAVKVSTAGGAVANVTGHYYPYDHLPGGLLVLPEGTAVVRSIDVEGLVPDVRSHLDVEN